MKLDRLLSMTMALLGSNRRLSANELAERFEVSLRTVYRDVETLNLAGIPVASYSGPEGGYEIMPGYSIEKQALTIDQLLSLYSAVKSISSATGSVQLAELLERIGALIPNHASPSADNSLNLQFASNLDVKEEVCVLDQAVRSLALVTFHYKNERGAETERTVEPMGLFLKRGVWYLWGYCRYRSALRVFRVNRMQGINVLRQTFERRNLTVEDIDKNKPKPAGIEVLLCFQPAVQTRVWEEFTNSQITAQADGKLQVRAFYYTKEQAVQHIASFGVNVRIVAPQEFIQAFCSHLDDILELYMNQSSYG
ncbi:helix-turn-helix transcriptional regulator [Paenibacillus sp. CN-4]|uniref:helix-turn-helix transcriptional regulator n=1 Tax=Paenibacillus nanchangensis TaxID=3348343 RepID=UPI00397833EA